VVSRRACGGGGGNLSLGWANSRGDSNSTFNTFNPQFNSTLTATYVQPLLRNFRTDQTRSQIRVTNMNREISEVQLRATITNTVSSVRNAYWDLLFARQAVDVARRSLSLAEKLVEDNAVRVEFGTMAPIDVVEARAEAATRRQQVAQAEALWRTAELALKRLIVDGTEDPFWQAEIDPTDRPLFQPEPIDLDAAIREAISKRTDIMSVRRQRDINDANIDLLHNQILPSVDVVASYGLQGIGGTQLVRNSTLGGNVVETVPGGYRNALDLLFGRDYPTWNLQLQFSQPLGQSAAAANYERAKIQLQQTRAQVNALELQIAAEVTNVALQVQSNETRVEAATAARELATQRLEAEESKFEVGMSTNFFVVQAQRDLADAQITELRAELDYRTSLVDFERVQQTSLTRAGITLVSGGGGGGGVTSAAAAGSGPGRTCRDNENGKAGVTR
jgi:outer membrane protein TolC